jgi:hypothetical protein
VLEDFSTINTSNLAMFGLRNLIPVLFCEQIMAIARDTFGHSPTDFF